MAFYRRFTGFLSSQQLDQLKNSYLLLDFPFVEHYQFLYSTSKSQADTA